MTSSLRILEADGELHYTYHTNDVLYSTMGVLIIQLKYDCHSAVSNITPHILHCTSKM